jgi:hypothetical protein
LLRHVALPLLFLTSALLGGLRFVGAALEMRFVPPPLVTLLLGAWLAVLFARTGLVRAGDWLGEDRPPLENVSNALTIAAGFAAIVQTLNAVMPEDTLFFSVFALLFGLVFWNSMFVVARADQFVRSLAGVLLVSFVAKYVLLAALFEPSESVTKTLVQTLLKGVTLGGLDATPYARATGYSAFAAVVLTLAGLWAASPPRDDADDALFALLADRRRLTPAERRRVLAALATPALPETVDAELVDESVEEDPSR